MYRYMMMQGVMGREGRGACIGVGLSDQKGSQHQYAGTAREQEDGISEALFYRGLIAASTITFTTHDPKLSLVRRLCRKICSGGHEGAVALVCGEDYAARE
jgi:hypothetical protein